MPDLNMDETLVQRLRTRAKIRRSIPSRKSVQDGKPDRIADLLDEAANEIEEHEQLFDLRWKADQRAIKRWQEAHPGNDLVWPDHADLCVWLMEQLPRSGLSDEQYATGRTKAGNDISGL